MLLQLEKYLHNLDEISQKVLFINSSNAHPAWEDAKEVLEKAEKQILTDTAQNISGDVLAFVGVQTPLPTSYSLGFLITSRYIFIQTKASMFSATGTADLIKIGSGEEHKAYEIFEQKCKFIIPDEVKLAIKNILEDVLQIISAYIIETPESGSLNLDELLVNFSLDGVLLKPDTDTKILKKANKVFKFSNVKLFALDEMIFSLSKPFGIIIDENGLATRDLGDEAVYSSWGEIANLKAKTHEENSKIRLGETIHFLPSQLEPLRENFINFLNLLSEKIVKNEIKL
ncbi:MAG: hypothetical protein Q4B95_01105 [Lonepinella koalarum]|nr:hypothetical protein [Lonepinella koalarum]